MAELSVLICTLNDRVANVPRILQPECEEIKYVVSFQYSDDMFLAMIPEILKSRRDIVVLPSPGVGLCANRNNALQHCTTPLAIIADDDSCFPPELFQKIISTFHNDNKLDILTFSGNRLAFRISPRLPQFDTRFGLGSNYLSCGEEEVFLHQAQQLGLNIKKLDLDNFMKDTVPWQQLAEDKRVRRSWGALQYMKHSTPIAFLLIIQKSVTMPIYTQRWQIFRDMLDGLRYIISHPLNDSVAEEIPLDFQPIDIWRMP